MPRIANHSIFWSLLITITLLFVARPIFEGVHPKPEYPEYVSKTIYLDVSFTDEEAQVIQEAADAWQQATHDRVHYLIQRMPKTTIDVANSILMIKVSPYFPEVLELDARDGNQTLGYYNHTPNFTYIALVDSRIPDEWYQSIVMHEFGHSLGLEHSHVSDTLMNPRIDEGSLTITDLDVQDFCRLHHCLQHN